MNATPEQLRAEAAQHLADAEESFQRCDTDGFLSQWASGLSAQEKRAQADILEAGGVDVFRGLYEVCSGRRVRAREVETKWGRAWRIDDPEMRFFGRRYIPTGRTSRIQRRLGLAERPELAPAEAYLASDGGTGLSGRVWVSVRRTGDRWGQDAQPLYWCERE